MKIGIDDLKRLMICPTLYKNKWDYHNSNKANYFLSFIIDEMFRWYARKGRPLTYDILCPIILTTGMKKDIDKLTITDIQISLKNFTKSGLYSKISIPIIEPEIVINGRNDNTIESKIPILSTINDRTILILYEDNIRTKEDIVQSYEAMIGAVWSFYSLNRYPTIYNIYKEDNKIIEVKFTPNQSYIRESKKYILKITEELKYRKNIYQAPYEICKQCYRRNECIMEIAKKIKQKI